MGEMIHGLSLCSGVGCIDLGLKAFFGAQYATVHYVEREAYCAEILVRRMEEGHLDVAPVFDDLSQFPGTVPGVDIVVSGLPCQPYSVAGKGLGNDDERALWPHFLRVVANCSPSAILLENVPGFLKHFGPVYAGLRDMGFEFAPPQIRTAQECGAPHIRRRLFIAASHPERRNIWDQQRGRSGASRSGQAGAGHSDSEHADPDGTGSQGRGRSSLTARTDQRAAGALREPITDPDNGRQQVERSSWILDRERQTLRYNADGLDHGVGTRRTLWQTESPVVRVDDGATTRVDELRAIGNGVVPDMVIDAMSEFATYFNGESQ